MITFLASPKPFAGLAFAQQRQAVQSWLALGRDVEVILYGQSAGIEEACRELGVTWMPDVAVNAYGTPLFGGITAHAAQHARHESQVYLNCDILLTAEFPAALRQVTFPQYLMVGSRLNLPRGYDIEITDPHWREQLLALARQDVLILQFPVGSDYFAFRRGLWDELPPIAIGRAGYDNALFDYCLRRGVPMIDATLAVIALHREHAYEHVSGGIDQVCLGEEARLNRAAIRHRYAIPTLEDAPWQLSPAGLARNTARGNGWRAAEARLRFESGHYAASLLLRSARLLFTRLGLVKPRAFTPQEVLERCLSV